jgi:Frataxin-like domain
MHRRVFGVRKAVQQLASRDALTTAPLGTRCAWIPQAQTRRTLLVTGVLSYHGTEISSLPVRRRRTNTRDGSRPKPTVREEDGANSEPRSHRKIRSVTDPDTFLQAATALLDKLHMALRPLIPINDNMLVTRGDEQPEGDTDTDDEEESDIVYGPFLLIDLGPVDGQYALTVDALQHLILFRSPISGQRVYHLTKAGDWCCVEDGHNLEGILVRDLIRQIKGVPNL